MQAFHHVAVSCALAYQTLRPKKAGLYGGHAEALTLRQAILETQPAKPTQNDPLVCRLVGILYFTVLAVVMIGWVWLLFEGFTWALA